MRSIKFYHQTFSIEIINDFFSQEIEIQTQEIIESISDRMFGKVFRDEIVFEHGGESHDFASDFVDSIEEASEKSWEKYNEFADQVVVEFIMQHRSDIVSYLWNELQQYQHRGHQFFDCGFSEVHGFQEEKVCDHCRPFLSRSVVVTE